MEKQNPGTDAQANTPANQTHVLRLYVAGASPNSVRAINNIKLICEKYLAGNYQLEIVDVYKEPAAAKEKQMIALPLLIKILPLPERRMIGDLSDTARVLKALSITG